MDSWGWWKLNEREILCLLFGPASCPDSLNSSCRPFQARPDAEGLWGSRLLAERWGDQRYRGHGQRGPHHPENRLTSSGRVNGPDLCSIIGACFMCLTSTPQGHSPCGWWDALWSELLIFGGGTHMWRWPWWYLRFLAWNTSYILVSTYNCSKIYMML